MLNNVNNSVKETDFEYYTFVANDKESDLTERTEEGEQIQIIVSEPIKRPFRCSFFQKAFQKSGNLKSHERIHTAEVPFECMTCKKKIKNKRRVKGT